MALHHNAIKCLRVAVLWSLRQVCYGLEWPAWVSTNHQIEPYKAGCHSRASLLHFRSIASITIGVVCMFWRRLRFNRSRRCTVLSFDCWETKRDHYFFQTVPLKHYFGSPVFSTVWAFVNIRVSNGRYDKNSKSNVPLFSVQSLALVNPAETAGLSHSCPCHIGKEETM